MDQLPAKVYDEVRITIGTKWSLYNDANTTLYIAASRVKHERGYYDAAAIAVLLCTYLDIPIHEGIVVAILRGLDSPLLISVVNKPLDTETTNKNKKHEHTSKQK